MQLTFFSNFLNHHQTPFCDEMYIRLNSNFTFVSTEKIPVSFLESGYPDCTNYSYNLNAFLDDSYYKRALQLGLESDIVIIGSASEIFIKDRIKQNKITFRYSERLLKQGNWQIFDPRVLSSLFRDHSRYRNKNLFILCASAYIANDLNFVFAYPRKKFKWGYFTKVEELPIEQIIAQKSDEKIEILWTARFLDWKHPELAVKLAFELKRSEYNFHLNMIGTGELYCYIQRLIAKLNISDHITLLGNMSNLEVRNYMRKSNIFIFTSDRKEGWGAVLNEAMSCGCAVVASNTIGAVPFLIQHKQNGLIFKSGNLSSLIEQTKSIIEDEILRNKIGINAYYTMVKEWSPEKAATNFMLLAQSKLNRQNISIETGPCSIAKCTKKNFWNI
ncbi:MAG: glycosyltransferase [Mariniphaga sp.]